MRRSAVVLSEIKSLKYFIQRSNVLQQWVLASLRRGATRLDDALTQVPGDGPGGPQAEAA